MLQQRQPRAWGKLFQQTLASEPTIYNSSWKKTFAYPGDLGAVNSGRFWHVRRTPVPLLVRGLVVVRPHWAVEMKAGVPEAKVKRLCVSE